jgi:hypothetical protein
VPSNDRGRVKGRKGSGSFTQLPHHIFRSAPGRPSPAAALSTSAKCLLVDLCHQYNGKNNGDIAAAPKTLEPYGWRSRGTVDDALVELVALGFLQQTRQGGRNRCSLYAITWQGIDEGPHDAPPNPVPSNLWKPDNAHLRDEVFLRRWHKRKDGHGRNASRHADKPSRHADKSAILRAVT